MNIGIIGLQGAGKTTIYNVLSDANVDIASYTDKDRVNEIKVPDERIDELADFYKPKKLTAATIKFLDTPALKKGAAESRKPNEIQFSEDAKQADAFVHVVRCFESDAVIHSEGSVNPGRDIDILELELKFHDMFVIERRIERLQKDMRNQKKDEWEWEKSVLETCHAWLMEEKPLRTIRLAEPELKIIRNYRFLSQKPILIVMNIAELQIQDKKLSQSVEPYQKLFRILFLCGKAEMEVKELPPPDQQEFLEAMGIKESSRASFIRLSYEMCELISFFTVGEDEVRAWTITEGDSAQKAAGKIHSDIERGFIRAETVSFEDLKSCEFQIGRARDKGLLRQEGKDYPVQDGDIINFKFSV